MLRIKRIFGLASGKSSASTATDSRRQLAKGIVDRGNAAQDSGAHEEAANLYREAIAEDPDFSISHMSLGIALLASGDNSGAIASLRTAIRLDAGNASAHYNLALALIESGAAAQAEVAFRTSLGIQPEFAEALVGLAETLETLGRDSDALAALDKAVALRDRYAGALINSALLLRKMGQPEAAEARLREIDPVTFFQVGKYTEAEDICVQLVSLWPDHAIGWKVLGAVRAATCRNAEAEGPFIRALDLIPGDAETHHNLAVVQHALGKFSPAEAHYRHAIFHKPDYCQAYNNLANLLEALGRHSEAETNCRRALAIDPDYVVAYSDLGNILAADGRYSEALQSFQRALELKPDFNVAHSNLGAALVSLGRMQEAEASFRRAIELKPDYREGYDNLLFLLNYLPDKSSTQVYSAYEQFDDRFGRPLRSTWRPHCNDRRPERRLRVGYVSPDFRKHAARHFVEPLFDRHDKSVVELFAYAEVPREDEVTARLKIRADHWVSTCDMDDAQMAERIRADAIDILVDLAGHTMRNRLPVFARKPAPVSVTTIGYGYTTGLSAIDWFMSDAVAAPAGVESVFSEGVWRLPVCQVYRPGNDMGPAGPLPAIRKGQITFGSLTRMVRINPGVIRTWARILRRVTDSRLCINSLNFRDPDLCATLASRFAAHGIGADRLEFGFHSPPWDVMREIDITLDCFPQNSGTTLFDSLYMGIPFITLADRPSLGRLGASIATHAGHPDWIARSEDEYVDKAVTLASDISGLSVVRAELRGEMRAGPLMDEPEYVRQVELAYREMWRQWCTARDG